MLIRATDEQIRKMCVLAVNASSPMGLAFLHFKPDTEFKPEDFQSAVTPRGCFLDYVQGRMVKLRMWNKGDGLWEAPDTISHEYESWIARYPSFGELAAAAGATIEAR